MRCLLIRCALSAATLCIALSSMQAQEWGNLTGNDPTYTAGKVGIGYNGHYAQRDLHIFKMPSDTPGQTLEQLTPGIRLESFLGVTNTWDMYADNTSGFHINTFSSDTYIEALTLKDNFRAGLWQDDPQTMLHLSDYRQLTFGHTGGDNDGLWGEYIGFNTMLGQNSEGRATVTKLASGSAGGGAQSGGSVVATDFWGNLEFQTLNTSAETGGVSGIPYDPQFIMTNKGVLEFRRSEENWTVNNWKVHTKAPLSTAWVSTSKDVNDEYHLGIGMTKTGWYFIRSKNAPGETDGTVDNCGNYPFYVSLAGKVTAREVEVRVDGWCDYVFEDDYDLMPLESLESFVNVNRHLPDIPPEAEVMADGIKLGEMNARLLKKVEELTLYVIEQNKRIQALETRK